MDTLTSKYFVDCPCGHRGTIHVEESRDPFVKHWEKFTLENLNGKELTIFAISVPWQRALQETHVSCPKCKARIDPAWIHHESEKNAA